MDSVPDLDDLLDQLEENTDDISISVDRNAVSVKNKVAKIEQHPPSHDDVPNGTTNATPADEQVSKAERFTATDLANNLSPEVNADVQKTEEPLLIDFFHSDEPSCEAADVTNPEALLKPSGTPSHQVDLLLSGISLGGGDDALLLVPERPGLQLVDAEKQMADVVVPQSDATPPPADEAVILGDVADDDNVSISSAELDALLREDEQNENNGKTTLEPSSAVHVDNVPVQCYDKSIAEARFQADIDARSSPGRCSSTETDDDHFVTCSSSISPCPKTDVDAPASSPDEFYSPVKQCGDGSDVSEQQLHALAKPLTVEVSPPPNEQTEADFGRIEVAAEAVADTDQAKSVDCSDQAAAETETSMPAAVQPELAEAVEVADNAVEDVVEVAADGVADIDATIAADDDDADDVGPMEEAVADEQPPPMPRRSLIASTHDMNLDPDIRLTESEMQLGKVKPYWIPDPDSPSCLLCMKKFTVVRRRHHCRSCGRVLCGACCVLKTSLPYNNYKEGKVCNPCYTTLTRIKQEEQAMKDAAEKRQAEHRQQLAVNDEDETNQQQPSSSSGGTNTAPSASGGGKSVMFGDGVRPGSGPDDPDEHRPDSPQLARPKKKRPRGNNRVSSRLTVLRVQCELESFLPATAADAFVVVEDGQRHKAPEDPEWLHQKLFDASEPPVEIALKRNLSALVKVVQLDCCWNGKRVWSVASRGLRLVGCNEVAVCLLADDDDELNESASAKPTPKNYKLLLDSLKLINWLYDQAMKGIRYANLSVSLIGEMDFLDTLFGCEDVVGVLYFAPSLQCLQGLLIPKDRYLFLTVVKRSELVWAKVQPNRLLFRLGWKSSHYPCPVVTEVRRKPVYSEIHFQQHQTVMNLFADLQAYSYSLPTLFGSVVSMENSKTTVHIPTCRHTKLVKLLEYRQHSMIAFATDLNPLADSHLVAAQQAESVGAFHTQLISIKGTKRAVTGASFIILDGSLKPMFPGEKCRQSLIEDGVRISLTADGLDHVLAKLTAMEDIQIVSKEEDNDCQEEATTLDVKFVNNEQAKKFIVAARFSPIDGTLLEGCSRLCVSADTAYMCPIPCSGGGASSLVGLRLTEAVLLSTDAARPFAEWAADVWTFGRQICNGVAQTLAPFVDVLLTGRVRAFSIRVTCGPDNSEYLVGPWGSTDSQQDTDSSMADVKDTWVTTLDDYLVRLIFTHAAQLSFNFTFEMDFAILELE